MGKIKKIKQVSTRSLRSDKVWAKTSLHPDQSSSFLGVPARDLCHESVHARSHGSDRLRAPKRFVNDTLCEWWDGRTQRITLPQSKAITWWDYIQGNPKRNQGDTTQLNLNWYMRSPDRSAPNFSFFWALKLGIHTRLIQRYREKSHTSLLRSLSQVLPIWKAAKVCWPGCSSRRFTQGTMLRHFRLGCAPRRPLHRWPERSGKSRISNRNSIKMDDGNISRIISADNGRNKTQTHLLCVFTLRDNLLVAFKIQMPGGGTEILWNLLSKEV